MIELTDLAASAAAFVIFALCAAALYGAWSKSRRS